MPPADPAGNSAKVLTLAGLAVQVVQCVAFLGIGFYLSSEPSVRTLLVLLGTIGIIWLLLVYAFSYRRMRTGDFVGARSPILVFAVLSVFTVSVLSGLLYILAYHELGSIEQGRPSSHPMRPPSPLRSESKVCPICSRANPLSTTFCQECGFALG
ncbi:MAG: hypothetical protein ACLPP2_00340 [Thermoplasmata archaeon]